MRTSKSTLYLVLSLTVLTTFGFAVLPDTVSVDTLSDFEFVYEINPRYLRTVDKEKTDVAMSVIDIIPEADSKVIASYHNIHVVATAEHRKDWVTEISDDEIFNEKQIAILRALDYGSSFSITGNVMKYDGDGNMFEDTLIYYLTAEPAMTAEYRSGKEDLIEYLKKNSEDVIRAATRDNVDPGKISFVVTAKGKIKNVELGYSCGHSSIDKRMLELIQKIPGKWEAARDSKGQSVDHQLTFFFGSIGC